MAFVWQHKNQKSVCKKQTKRHKTNDWGTEKNTSLSVKFKYVSTDQNPADLLTRGVTFEKFQQRQRRWTLGPEWLGKNPIEWPSSELHYLSSKNKSIVQSTSLNYTVANVEPQPVIPFDKYSDVIKLINVTTNIFKIRNKLKHVDLDPSSCAKIYLLKIM